MTTTMPTLQAPGGAILRDRLEEILLKDAPLAEVVRSLVDCCTDIPQVRAAWLWCRPVNPGTMNLASQSGVPADLVEHLQELPGFPALVDLLQAGQIIEDEWSSFLGDPKSDFLLADRHRVTIVPALVVDRLEGALGLVWNDDHGDGVALRETEAWPLVQLATRILGLCTRMHHLEGVRDHSLSVIQGMEDAVFIVNRDRRLLSTNYPYHGVKDPDLLDSVFPNGVDILKNHRAEGEIGGKPFGERSFSQSRMRTPQGDLIPVEVSVKTIRWGADEAYLLTCRDITNRLVIERERERLFMAIQQIADSVIITDSTGSILYTNPAFTKTTGYTSEEVYGENPRILRSDHHDASFYQSLWSTIKRGETWQGRLVNRNKSGELFWEVATISPVRDTLGVITHYVCVKRDITHEVKQEERWRRSQKLEAIGTLAGGIAHDFNNILYALLGNAQLAMDDIPADHPAYLPLNEIVKAGDRGSNLVNKMLAFGQRNEGRREAQALQPIINEAMDLVRASLPASIEIVVDLPRNDVIVEVDDTQIHQVLVNLFNNAAHAMAGQGACTLRLRKVSVASDSCEADEGVPAGQYHMLEFGDTGAGMDQGIMARIFEPYFTTKKAGEGTGLGLASVHGIVRNHGGHILVASTPGKGTTFSIYLPQVMAEATPEKAKAPARVEVHSEGRIMVVDDEQMILNMVDRGLSRSGFKVTTFADGVEALEYFRGNPDAFDVVLTEQTMPNITGFELASALSSIRPDLPIVLSTGYAETMQGTDLKMVGFSHLLRKPLKINELAKVMGEICNPVVAGGGK